MALACSLSFFAFSGFASVKAFLASRIRFLAASVPPVVTSVFTGWEVVVEFSTVNTGMAFGAIIGSGFTAFSFAKVFASNAAASTLSLAP
ncbi:MAG: hypothetical protein EBT02_06870 [Planctomycetia bacterium]|nr:hypothetical protein [Planctomycetia bacterium]